LASEFIDAGHSYPIVFAGAEHLPVALVGLDDRNRFVKNEAWQFDAYVPAYVRRYPFALTPLEGGGVVMSIDAEAPNLLTSGTEGEPPFEDGKPTALMDQGWSTCRSYVREYGATKQFVKLLEEHKLLVE
jgi:hypothetical protein